MFIVNIFMFFVIVELKRIEFFFLENEIEGLVFERERVQRSCVYQKIYEFVENRNEI